MDHRFELGAANRTLVLGRAISRIGPYRLRDVLLDEHMLEGTTIVACGMGDGPLTDKAEGAVDTDLIPSNWSIFCEKNRLGLAFVSQEILA